METCKMQRISSQHLESCVQRKSVSWETLPCSALLVQTFDLSARHEDQKVDLCEIRAKWTIEFVGCTHHVDRQQP